MIKRWVRPYLEERINRVLALALLGPRQVGKTTLAKELKKKHNSLYLDLQDQGDLLKLRDPPSFLSQHKDKLMIIDEIQFLPELMASLRGAIDRNRQRGKKGGAFLLLGSASMDFVRQSSESLAGRIHYVSMSGLNVLEVPMKKSRLLWIRGGFPESYLESSHDESFEWREMLIRTYLEKDIPQLGFRLPATRLRRLWTMVAHLHGGHLNYSKLGSNLEVDGKTISHYLDILIGLLLVRRLNPWYKNTKKRLIKSPRFYIRDSGLLHRLLGIFNEDDLLSHPLMGKSWEGFVIENILSVLPNRVEYYYYQSSIGTEIDLILKIPDGELWAIEIKYGLAPKIRPSFHRACQDIKATKKFIVYGGDDEFPIEKGAIVISLRRLMKKWIIPLFA